MRRAAAAWRRASGAARSARLATSKSSTSCPESGFQARAPSRATTRCPSAVMRSEEHTSELQSHSDLVCRLLLEKKKKTKKIIQSNKATNNQRHYDDIK